LRNILKYGGSVSLMNVKSITVLWLTLQKKQVVAGYTNIVKQKTFSFVVDVVRTAGYVHCHAVLECVVDNIESYLWL
jgi:hypothetical protein